MPKKKKKVTKPLGLRESIINAASNGEAETMYQTAIANGSYPERYLKRCLRALKRRGHAV